MSGLKDRLDLVNEQVTQAARESGRDPGSITTVVVTKFHPASLVRELYDLGVRNFGESRHQEAAPKVAELDSLEATWHFVGQLQSKKARLVSEYVDVIHSVDRDSLVAALDSGGAVKRVFAQVNLTSEPDRGGVSAAELPNLVDRIARGPGLELLGLMTVAPLDEEPRRAFAALRSLSERVRQTHPEASALSMGMSGDFVEAIWEGATHLRIGTAITGNRTKHG